MKTVWKWGKTIMLASISPMNSVTIFKYSLYTISIHFIHKPTKFVINPISSELNWQTLSVIIVSWLWGYWISMRNELLTSVAKPSSLTFLVTKSFYEKRLLLKLSSSYLCLSNNTYITFNKIISTLGLYRRHIWVTIDSN